MALWLAFLAVAGVLALAWWYALLVPGRPHAGPLPPATSEEDDLAPRLRHHVVAIASSPHNLSHYEALERAAQYIEGVLEGLAYDVHRQVFTVAGRPVRNIEVQREAQSPEASLVVGAHYDSFETAPGANDNGSGVAVVLELALGLPGSRSFLHEVIASFRRHTAFPSIGGAAPDALVPGIGWSDHWAFRSFGYPGIMITDTALFRYPHYHLPSDTPDKVDYPKLARITKGFERVMREVAH